MDSQEREMDRSAVLRIRRVLTRQRRSEQAPYSSSPASHVPHRPRAPRREGEAVISPSDTAVSQPLQLVPGPPSDTLPLVSPSPTSMFLTVTESPIQMPTFSPPSQPRAAAQATNVIVSPHMAPPSHSPASSSSSSSALSLQDYQLPSGGSLPVGTTNHPTPHISVDTGRGGRGGGGGQIEASTGGSRHQLQRLVVLLHAHRCLRRDREIPDHRCTLPNCRETKELLVHMTTCHDSQNCSCKCNCECLSHTHAGN